MKELELKTGSSVVDIKTRLLALEEGVTRAITLYIVIIEGWNGDQKIITFSVWK
ncbi:hypothetical protein [Paenibacillus polymyxa]|uniref:hypothetical protein n=1 Tax=Paenibacillus polymyxa TaxID=1406 RepID=UPI002024B74E|nr:hypothetical protein [Paenibacillus polymyxa]URJ58239.1 hypothetical protein MF622_002762 [Paenibacillus polymyxa]